MFYQNVVLTLCRAGLKPGDIVTHINDKPVVAAESVHSILESSAEKELRMRVLRQGGSTNITVVPEN